MGCKLAGTIIADFIRTDANQLSLNVGNTTFATINASGFFSNTGTQLIAANGKVSGASVISGSITSAAIATAANTIPRSSMTTGAVLQVISTIKTDTFSTTSTSFADITGLSISITPTSATSKIYVVASVCGGVNGGNNTQQFRLVRDSTAIGVGDASGSRTRSTSGLNYQADSNRLDSFTFQHLDSPSTTSATTYKVQSIVSSGTVYINRTYGDADGATWPRTVSTITVMEIAG